MSVTDRVAVVTGSNQGFGLAVAERLVTEGMHVMLAARDRRRLAAAAESLATGAKAGGVRVLWQAMDVTRQDDVHGLIERVMSEFGRLDVLVCSAGVYGPKGLIEDVAWEEWCAAITINLIGLVMCCREAMPIMRRQRVGKIIVLSGGGATAPLPRLSAYAASKAAVVRFAETLAEEARGSGIDVNAVAPGALNTRLLDEVIEAGPEAVGASFYQRAVRQKAEGGTPLEVGAELVAFLASPASDGITGRLISAVWDEWRELPSRRDQLATSDVYTLRRIVPSDRGW